MKIQLVAYKLGIRRNSRIEFASDIINESEADLIVFPGGTVADLDEAQEVVQRVENRKPVVLFEVRKITLGVLGHEIWNCPFLILNGKLVNMHTFQLFSRSHEIENNPFLAEAFVTELETRRLFMVCGKQCLELECGENNILRNIQNEGNRPVVRIDDEEVKARFENVLKDCDIVLNLIHEPQPGNQNKLDKRREYLSGDGRAYFSTNNYDELSVKAQSIQYAYVNGRKLPLPEPVVEERGRYMFRCFDVIQCNM